jgi:hypothetical protein
MILYIDFKVSSDHTWNVDFPRMGVVEKNRKSDDV